MSEKGPTTESEEVETQVSHNPFTAFLEKITVRDFLVGILAIYIYYIIADEFVRQSLLNLTPGRFRELDLPFKILPEAVDSGTTYFTVFLAILK